MKFWTNLKPVTRITAIVCVTIIIVALIYTGQLQMVIDLFK